MAVMVFALSFGHVADRLPSWPVDPVGVDGAGRGHLGRMTHIFRQAFGTIFAEGRTFAGTAGVVDGPEATVSLRRAALFGTAEASLIGDDGHDHLLVALIDFVPRDPAADTRTAWRSLYGTEEAKLALARALGLGAAVPASADTAGRRVGQTSTPLPDDVDAHEQDVLAVFAFYAAGWLRALRIERRQLAVRLPSTRGRAMVDGVGIADQRLRILDQQRYFLTGDRTNDLPLRAWCAALVTKFKLAERNARALELHAGFEHHLDNATKLYSAGRLGSVSNLILVLTILSIPISVFSAIFAINSQSEALEKPWTLASDYRVYKAFLIGAGVVAVTFALLRLLDRLLRR